MNLNNQCNQKGHIFVILTCITLLFFSGTTSADVDSGLIKAATNFDSGKYLKASYYYQKILFSDNKNAEARYGLAHCLYRSNHYSKALVEVNKLMADHPYHEQGLMLSADIYSAQYNWQQLMLIVDRLIQTNPLNEHAYMHLDNMYSITDDIEAAENARQRYEQVKATGKK